jgi:hypothetical protein
MNTFEEIEGKTFPIIGKVVAKPYLVKENPNFTKGLHKCFTLLIGGSQVSELLGELSAVGYTSKYNNLSLIKRVRKDYNGEFTVRDISISKLCGSGSSQMIF